MTHSERLEAERPLRVWKRLPVERRQIAATAFWKDPESEPQRIEAVAAIARRLNFRPKSVLGLPLDRKARYLASLPEPSDLLVVRMLVAYHLETQRPMMSAFLDALGIAHEEGLIKDDDVKPDAARLANAATELRKAYPAEDVDIYFRTLLTQDPETWGGLSQVDAEGDTASARPDAESSS